MEEEMDLSQWEEKGGHRETVYKPGGGAQEQETDNHRLQMEEEVRRSKETKAACQESTSKGREAAGNAQSHQRQVIVHLRLSQGIRSIDFC